MGVKKGNGKAKKIEKRRKKDGERICLKTSST